MQGGRRVRNIAMRGARMSAPLASHYSSTISFRGAPATLAALDRQKADGEAR